MRSMTIVLAVLALLGTGCGGRGRAGGGDDDDDEGNQNDDELPGDADDDPGPGDDDDEPGPIGGGGGSNGCIAFFDCAGYCADDACVHDCAANTSQAGLTAANEVMTCFQGACGGVPEADVQSCLEQSCPDELQSCT
jgi:hypothetical protein